MPEKISPIAVVKETLKISWARKWSLLGLFFSGFALMTIPMFLPVVFQENATVMHWVAPLMSLVVMLVLCTTVWRLAITQMRGAGRVFSASLPRDCVDVFIKALVCMLVLLSVMAVTIGPVAVLWIAVAPPQGTASEVFPLVGVSLLGTVAYVFSIWVAVRLSFMPVGAAVGHRMWVKEAWRMTRGHGLRMIAASLILMAGFAVLSVPLALGLIVEETSGALSFIKLLLSIAFFLFALASNAVAYVLPAVWYEKLRIRHEAQMAAQSETEPEFDTRGEA